MNVNDILWNPRLLHRLVGDRVFQDDEMVLVDVGMRAGIPEQWTMLQDQMHVIGFEPDQAECERLNGLSTAWRQICYPYALDARAQTRQLYLREHNRAADGLFTRTWWSKRFGAGTAEEMGRFRSYRKWEDQENQIRRVPIQTTSYSDVAQSENLPRPDFMKIDVEGAELDVLRGAETALGTEGTLGIEIEVRLLPLQDCPLFMDVYRYLSDRGYYLFNFSPHRNSRRALPIVVAWDHRDQAGEQITGPGTLGQITEADVLFARDLIAEDFFPAKGDRRALLRILKAVVMFELYNLPDCAAELLLFYRDALTGIVDVDQCLEQLVPEGFGFEGSGAYVDYLRAYHQGRGRLSSTSEIRESASGVSPAPAQIDVVAPRELGPICGGDGSGHPESAFDRDPATFWVSSQRGTDVKGQAWVGYAYAEPTIVRRVWVKQPTQPWFRQDFVRIELSTDGGGTWDQATPEPVRLDDNPMWIDLPENPPARVWRLVAAADNATEWEHVWAITDMEFVI